MVDGRFTLRVSIYHGQTNSGSGKCLQRSKVVTVVMVYLEHSTLGQKIPGALH